MRHTYEALVGMMLMLVVMMASVGVTYVRCVHTGSVSMAMADDMESMNGMGDGQCHEGSHDGGVAVKSSHCMEVSVMKLLTQFQQPQSTIRFFVCQTMAVVPFIVLLLPAPIVALARPLMPQTASGYYGSPRSYLRRLGVLII